MQIQKTDIRKVILEVSKREFIEHGFKDASMRTIAKKSGVSLSNIYNYFKNKDEIFTHILSVPVSLLNKVNNIFDDEYFLDIENIRNEKIKQLKFTYSTKFICNYRDELNLLLFKAHGSSLQNFKDSWYSEKEKKVVYFCMTPYYFIILYSLFVSLKFGTILFAIAFIIYIVSLIALINAYVTYRTVPSGKFAVKGVYKLSRHPQYFFSIIGFLSVAIAGTSWLILLLIIMYAIPQHLIIKGEERFCLEKYDEEYRKYMKRTPRYFKIPKSQN